MQWIGGLLVRHSRCFEIHQKSCFLNFTDTCFLLPGIWLQYGGIILTGRNFTLWDALWADPIPRTQQAKDVHKCASKRYHISCKHTSKCLPDYLPCHVQVFPVGGDLINPTCGKVFLPIFSCCEVCQCSTSGDERICLSNRALPSNHDLVDVISYKSSRFSW